MFTFERLPGGDYQVREDAGGILGQVGRGRGGWWSRPSGDTEATPADRPTRQGAAERLVLIRHVRAISTKENRPAPVPDGFEIVDAAEVKPGDVVLTADRLTGDGQVKAWSRYGPRVVREVTLPVRGPGAVLGWVNHGAAGCEWPGMAIGEGWRRVARRTPGSDDAKED